MKCTPQQRLFLLGGQDLEMLTIKEMLDSDDDSLVLDKHLRWDNALLSKYQHEMEQHERFDIYGIELQEDIPPKNNYHRIDHHNDFEDKPSALEQVGELLGVRLNRYQQLVAANDKGYIPAMEALSATPSEIAEIRAKDRAAQGINPEDERLAEISVKDHLSRLGQLTIVKAFTSHFSPICDRLYPWSNLLIYTDDEWTFYGEGKEELKTLLADDIKQKKVYHGGGKKGYIGAVKQAYTKTDILKFVEIIKRQYEHV